MCGSNFARAGRLRDKWATLKIASGSVPLLSLVITGSADTIAPFENKVYNFWANMRTIPRVSVTTDNGDQEAMRHPPSALLGQRDRSDCDRRALARPIPSTLKVGIR